MHSDDDAVFDAVVELNGAEIEPQVSWGTSPEMVIPVSKAVPTLEQAKMTYNAMTGHVLISIWA